MKKLNKVPVLFIIFNRPDTSAEVFKAIREYRPNKLYVSADGPRFNRVGEEIKCQQSREIIENIDWPCEVFRNYEAENLGCKDAVSNAISWFFQNEERGIILEDDCLPSPSFFLFCEELLERYKDDTSIMSISGQNFLNNKTLVDSYYFSEYPLIWGWATWKRAWILYDKEMNNLDQFINVDLQKKFTTRYQRLNFTRRLVATKTGRINTWDYQWFYTILRNNGKSIISTRNLVVNIGFRNNATHEFIVDSSRENNKLELMTEIIHPTSLEVDKNLDLLTYNNVFSRNAKRLMRLIRENGGIKILSYSLRKFFNR